MNVDPLRHFRQVWAADFAFAAPPGHCPRPLGLAAREIRGGKLARVWLDPRPLAGLPYGTGDDVLVVGYHASDLVGCHLALGRPTPVRILDLDAEDRCLTAGLDVGPDRSLAATLARYGLSARGVAETGAGPEMAGRGPPYRHHELTATLDRCQSRTDAIVRLLRLMLPQIDLPRALFRGRYTAAVARMEWVGVPFDTDMLGELRDGWDRIRGRLIDKVNKDYGFWVPDDPKAPDGPYTFSQQRFETYLARQGIPWPRRKDGTLVVNDETFRDMAKLHPARIGPVWSLRRTLAHLRPNELAVGSDGRHRASLRPFASKTGRNQPRTSRFVFGQACWVRSLIKPAPGRAVAYVDWSQQELGIAAALSRDPGMMAAYQTGDFYLTFAKMAGAVPKDATKASHAEARGHFKRVALGVLYGLGGRGLAQKLGLPPARGRELIEMHRRAFPVFWAWSQHVQDRATRKGFARTSLGWTLRVGPDTKPTTLRNFLPQATGADLMRVSACLATERGIAVACVIHDAFLIEADADAIDTETARMREVMREASTTVLSGFPLETDAKVVRHPERYVDDRGREMWARVLSLLADP